MTLELQWTPLLGCQTLQPPDYCTLLELGRSSDVPDMLSTPAGPGLTRFLGHSEALLETCSLGAVQSHGGPVTRWQGLQRGQVGFVCLFVLFCSL